MQIPHVDVADIGECCAAIMREPEKWANRTLHLHSS
jgi:hypothetical protein